MPIIFCGTGGLALIPIQSLQENTFKSHSKETHVVIFNPKNKSFQILNEAKHL